VSRSATNDPNYQVLVYRFRSSKQWDRAWEYAREWLSAEPENVRAHEAAAEAAIKLNRHTEARPHIQRVLQSEPNNPYAHRLLSSVCFQAGDIAGANGSIRKAISLKPNDPANWHLLGWMCWRHGHPAVARGYLEKARGFSPNDPNIINLLALCEPASPNAASRQLEQYRRALELDPENFVVLGCLGYHYLKVENDPKTAESFLRQALSLNPSDAASRRNLLLCLSRRDPFLRILREPRELLAPVLASIRSFLKTSPRWIHILLGFVIALWIVPVLFLAGALCGLMALWYFFVWPPAALYGRLALRDIRAQAGEIAPGKRGFFASYRWPLKARLAILAAFLAAYWGGTAFCIWHCPEYRRFGIFLCFGTGLICWLVSAARHWARKNRQNIQARKKPQPAQTAVPPKPAQKTGI
jgi:Flp pilus assembly protein TadD